MSSSENFTTDSDRQYRRSRKGCCAKGNWSGMNIAAMVIGFVLFWPVGLVILYWNIKGRNVKDLPNAIQEKWTSIFGGESHSFDASSSENSLFNEFQQTQYDRIKEIKEEIKNRAHSFKDYRENARRRADEDEFNSFMSSSPKREEN